MPAEPLPIDLPTVHIVDDDEGMRLGLDSLLRSAGLSTLLFASADEFKQFDRRDKSGCMIVDIRLPEINGLDFHDELAALGVRMPVIFITGYGDVPMSVRAMKAGAIDFLGKPFQEADVLSAVTAALDRDARRRAQEDAAAATNESFNAMSMRERQVMALVTSGKMNKQAAYDLKLSEITVKIHRGSAMRKMDARSLADLVRMAEALDLTFENALIDRPGQRGRMPTMSIDAESAMSS